MMTILRNKKYILDLASLSESPFQLPSADANFAALSSNLRMLTAFVGATLEENTYI